MLTGLPLTGHVRNRVGSQPVSCRERPRPIVPENRKRYSSSMKTHAITAAITAFLLTCGALAQGVGKLFNITGGTSNSIAKFHHIDIPKGGEQLLGEFRGAGKVTYFYMTDESAGKWYPGLMLKIYWDGQKFPSIHMPVADFFGAIGGRAVPYRSEAMVINHACFMSHLPMPYGNGARFVLENDGDRDYSIRIAYGIDVEQDNSSATEKSRLHGEWRRSNPVKDGLHTLMETRGRGHYIGGFLQVVVRNHGVWFGEGDLLCHVDGRSYVHSPGTEDEYGSCWASPSWPAYDAPLSGHPLNENGVNRMYRWYVHNPVRFRENLKVEIQNQHVNGTPATEGPDDYTSVAFWYQEGASKVVAPQPFPDRQRPSFEEKK
ncbi:MAG: DUF2961 domain-containing protein [Verrucomicrobiaceae bacterium]|nr:MAG: DUF2961 domain-containing protein [Verrucomicrobiaceae bacterium]